MPLRVKTQTAKSQERVERIGCLLRHAVLSLALEPGIKMEAELLA